ncbi:hypothetical protein CASFOL_021238 [Castilleja foliolosa]|uniref:RNase H type-1 domain-containing protein n=1 Tax=Castilleja foliolosa TaxID=1961234 RepID=A0ABD3CX72_9LAMI
MVQWIGFVFDFKNLLFNSFIERHEFILFNAILFDNIWRYRNSLAHGGPSLTIQKLVATISRQANYHWLSINQSIQAGSSTNHPWKSPPPGWKKINVDAAFSNDSACSGIVLKDTDGSILYTAAFTHSCIDALTAESLAILDACLYLMSINVVNVIIESDSLNAISFINGSSSNSFWTASPVVDKIKKAWNNWPSWIFKFTPRSANRAAHALAKWAVINSFVDVIPVASIPISVFCDQGYPLVKNH